MAQLVGRRERCVNSFGWRCGSSIGQETCLINWLEK